MPNAIADWSPTNPQQWLVKMWGRLSETCSLLLLLAESHLTWRIFEAIVGRIGWLPVAAG